MKTSLRYFFVNFSASRQKPNYHCAEKRNGPRPHADEGSENERLNNASISCSVGGRHASQGGRIVESDVREGARASKGHGEQLVQGGPRLPRPTLPRNPTHSFPELRRGKNENVGLGCPRSRTGQAQPDVRPKGMESCAAGPMYYFVTCSMTKNSWTKNLFENPSV